MENTCSQSREHSPSDYEFLSPIGYGNSSRCGYCGAEDSEQIKRYCYYVRAKSISPQFYQSLLDWCWRRSGTLLYRPNQRQACCPHYTIRLDSSQFKPSRDQRQIINRFNRHVLGENYLKEAARLYPRSREECRKRDNEFQLIERVHEAEYAGLPKPSEPAHKFTVTLEDDDFTEEKYQVYSNYQEVVHKDAPSDRTRHAFRRFLCNSPLRRHTIVGPNGRHRRQGSYHQCYRIDGELVAIGVLDLLPHCVSSVYFLYLDSFSKHAPGKLGALFEISLAIQDGYRWWYPGFYIHSCPKMRYKNDYSPQYLLDPHSLTWDPLDAETLKIFDRKAFVSLSLERQAINYTQDQEVMSNLAEAVEEMVRDQADDQGDTASLLKSNMPGIPSLAEMEEVDLGSVALKIRPSGPLFKTSDLVDWHTSGIADWPSSKAAVAELVAALGLDFRDRICLDSSPSK